MNSKIAWRIEVSAISRSSTARVSRIFAEAGAAFVISRSLPPSFTTRSAAVRSDTGAPLPSVTVT